MSNIRRFPGADEISSEYVEAKSKRRKQIRLYAILAIIILAAVSCIICYLYIKTKEYKSYTKLTSVDSNASSGSTLASFNGSIMSYGKDGAEAMDASGKLLWNQTFDMQYPLMSMCDDTVAFADYGGSTIYIQTAGGTATTVTTNMPIRKISVSSGGYVVAVLEDINVTWIYMYDFNGKEISYFRTTMEKSGYPVDVDISPSGELVAVSYYYLDVEDIRSSVAFYNFGGVGQNNIDNYVSGYNFKDDFIPLVRFVNNESAFSISAEQLNFYKDAHKPVSEQGIFLQDEVLSVFYGDNAVALILRNSSIENQYRMEVYDTVGKLLFYKEFDFDYTEVAFGGNQVVLYGDTNIYVATLDGMRKFEGSYEEPILLLLPLQSRMRFAVVTERTIDTIELK